MVSQKPLLPKSDYLTLLKDTGPNKNFLKKLMKMIKLFYFYQLEETIKILIF